MDSILSNIGIIWYDSTVYLVEIDKKSYGFADFHTLKNSLAITEKTTWNILVLL